MAVHNRTLGGTEQRKALTFENFELTLTSGDTGVIMYIPYPCNLEALNVAAFAVASSPFLLFNVQRFIPGTGATVFAIGTTFTPRSFGTSGVLTGLGVTLSASIPSGASGIPLMANDVIGYQVGGTGGTCLIDGLVGAAIVQPSQDVKVFLGSL